MYDTIHVNIKCYRFINLFILSFITIVFVSKSLILYKIYYVNIILMVLFINKLINICPYYFAEFYFQNIYVKKKKMITDMNKTNFNIFRTLDYIIHRLDSHYNFINKIKLYHLSIIVFEIVKIIMCIIISKYIAIFIIIH